MSKGYRDGAFALGLVTGIGLALNLVLWLSYASKQKVASNSEGYQGDQSADQAEFWWWRWTGDLISSGDTLAQWIMAVVTIVATVVLLLTLRSANKTNAAAVKATNAALEANKYIREGQRPFLSIQDKEVSRYIHLGRMYRSYPSSPALIRVINKGLMPSFHVTATFVIFSHDTIDATQVAEMAEQRIMSRHSIRDISSTAAFPNEAATIQIFPLPPKERVIGSGDHWSIMIICLYEWDGEVKSTWMWWGCKKPPSNVLKNRSA